MEISEIVVHIVSAIITIFSLCAAITSFREKERRATIILVLIALLLPITILAPLYIFTETIIYQHIVLITISALILLFILPIRRKNAATQKYPKKRFHEEDAVLSRRLLKPGTSAYENYYKERPAFKLADDSSREKPGLLSEDSKYYNLASYTSADANFELTDHLHSLEKREISDQKRILDKEKTAAYIKWWLEKSGAHSVGFTVLKDHHLYSHKGRGPKKGEEIKKDLPYAIALTVEMDFDMMKYAPAGPTVMESAQEYLNSGILASKLVSFIKNLGYTAKAHIDGNYEVICPLVATDAGLGVIGRMGLLMTPDIGPRVRLAVVTTDLPLQVKEKKQDFSAIDFCKRCKKCADVCPASAIPSDDRAEIDGALRWRINSERCYNFWTISGTDCGQCMISCPYSHPNNWFHSLIRWGIKNNLLFRIIAVKLDDVFYGRKPRSQKLPDLLNLDLNK